MDEYRQIFAGRFRSMVDDPPEMTGRYCVGHGGATFGDAYYTARDGDTHYPVGWSQVPRFWPTFWVDFGTGDLPRGGTGVDGRKLPDPK